MNIKDVLQILIQMILLSLLLSAYQIIWYKIVIFKDIQSRIHLLFTTQLLVIFNLQHIIILFKMSMFVYLQQLFILLDLQKPYQHHFLNL